MLHDKEINEVFLKTEASQIKQYELNIRTSSSKIIENDKNYKSVYSEGYPRSVFYEKSDKIDRNPSKIKRLKKFSKNLFSRKKVSDTKCTPSCDTSDKENFENLKKLENYQLCNVNPCTKPLLDKNLFLSDKHDNVNQYIKVSPVFSPNKLTSITDKIYKVNISS